MKNKADPPQKTLEILIYDDCAASDLAQYALRASWRIGGFFYQKIGRFDRSIAASSWQEALSKVITLSLETGLKISEIQFWGHGQWGAILFGNEILSVQSFTSTHTHFALLEKLRDCMYPENSLFWLRSCKSFATLKGQLFAEQLSQMLRCNVAGHTYIIGPFQSGLQYLKYGDKADWDLKQGLKSETDTNISSALWSTYSAPHTILFLQSRIPKDFFV